MTESNWLASTDPALMLGCLSGRGPFSDHGDMRLFHDYHVSERQLTLLAQAWESPLCGRHQSMVYREGSYPADRHQFILAHMLDADRPMAAHLLRDVCGNPWVVIERVHARCTSRARNPGPGQRIMQIHDSWLTPTVRALVEAAYAEPTSRMCLWCAGHGICRPDDGWNARDRCTVCHGTGREVDGSLDPTRLAILADALEDAGCDNADILMHLRGKERCPKCEGSKQRVYHGTGRYASDVATIPCPHCEGNGWIPKRSPCVRGCHVLDLLRGNS